MKKIFLALVFNFICGVGFAQEKSENDSIEDNKVYVQVDEIATPKDGMQNYYMKFASKFRVPQINDKTIKEVRVMVSFVVEKDGSFSDIKVLRNPGYGVGEEAVRVLKSMDRWKSGKNNGQNVRTQFTLPITIAVR